MATRDFPRPGLGTIAAAIAGNQGPNSFWTGLTIPAIQIDPRHNAVRGAYIYADRIDRLGMSFKSFKQPLQTALEEVVIPSIARNFEAQGRPPWQKLQKKTIYARLLHGHRRGPILDETGRLKRESLRKNIWEIRDNTLKLRTNYYDQKVPYAQFHQLGARFPKFGIGTPRTIGKLFTTVGSPKGTFEDQSRVVQELNGPGKLPARPFMKLTSDEEAEIYNIFTAFMVEKVNKYWGHGEEGL